MIHADLRTSTEIFADMMLAEDIDDDTAGIIPSAADLFDKIADRLGWTWGQARRHYIKICDQLGVNPDGD